MTEHISYLTNKINLYLPHLFSCLILYTFTSLIYTSLICFAFLYYLVKRLIILLTIYFGAMIGPRYDHLKNENRSSAVFLITKIPDNISFFQQSSW